MEKNNSQMRIFDYRRIYRKHNSPSKALKTIVNYFVKETRDLDLDGRSIHDGIIGWQLAERGLTSTAIEYFSGGDQTLLGQAFGLIRTIRVRYPKGATEFAESVDTICHEMSHIITEKENKKYLLGSKDRSKYKPYSSSDNMSAYLVSKNEHQARLDGVKYSKIFFAECEKKLKRSLLNPFLSKQQAKMYGFKLEYVKECLANCEANRQDLENSYDKSKEILNTKYEEWKENGNFQRIFGRISLMAEGKIPFDSKFLKGAFYGSNNGFKDLINNIDAPEIVDQIIGIVDSSKNSKLNQFVTSFLLDNEVVVPTKKVYSFLLSPNINLVHVLSAMDQNKIYNGGLVDLLYGSRVGTIYDAVQECVGLEPKSRFKEAVKNKETYSEKGIYQIIQEFCADEFVTSGSRRQYEIVMQRKEMRDIVGELLARIDNPKLENPVLMQELTTILGENPVSCMKMSRNDRERLSMEAYSSISMKNLGVVVSDQRITVDQKVIEEIKVGEQVVETDNSIVSEKDIAVHYEGATLEDSQNNLNNNITMESVSVKQDEKCENAEAENDEKSFKELFFDEEQSQ